ncbi:Cytochrome c oxidase subunit 6B [Orbilia brochopaga]|uniref:Cytochrome c oxidase subunit 6B n=1 Tax=Orbilia brochopaga TaxID=3140254 RepID=A0AAV9VE84_9PEZI
MFSTDDSPAGWPGRQTCSKWPDRQPPTDDISNDIQFDSTRFRQPHRLSTAQLSQPHSHHHPYSSPPTGRQTDITMADEEERVTKPFKFVTGLSTYVHLRHTPSSRTSTHNKQCWQNYVDYHKCILAKGEDFQPCRQFYHAYRSLCPSSWITRWDEQRDAGIFPVILTE